VYSTYLAGSNDDLASGIAVDGAGNAYVAGVTLSSDFAGAAPLHGSIVGNGNPSAFAVKLGPSGTTLAYSVYVGGNQTDGAQAIAIDQTGSAYIAGYTDSDSGFPVSLGALQTKYTGLPNGNGNNAFITKINPAGSDIAYSTYLGGAVFDVANGIAVDGAGSAYVTGYTQSQTFPTTAGAFQTTFQISDAGGSQHAFASKINPAGTALVYSTLLGGSNVDVANAIGIDIFGDAFVVGGTQSTDFPTARALQPHNATPAAHVGQHDAFVTVLNPTATALTYSTYLGGEGDDIANAVAVDAAGHAFVAGVTNSFDTGAGGAFPTSGLAAPVQPVNNSLNDGFVSAFTAQGDALFYSTYLGGGQEDWALGIAVDQRGNAFVTGFTQSPTLFPVVAAPDAAVFQSQLDIGSSSQQDAFVAELPTAFNATTPALGAFAPVLAGLLILVALGRIRTRRKTVPNGPATRCA
jgi:hypothetical protein